MQEGFALLAGMFETVNALDVALSKEPDEGLEDLALARESIAELMSDLAILKGDLERRLYAAMPTRRAETGFGVVERSQPYARTDWDPALVPVVLAKVLLEVANDLPEARAARLGKAMADLLPGRVSWRVGDLAKLGYDDEEWCRKERREVVAFTGDSERVREALALRAQVQSVAQSATL